MAPSSRIMAWVDGGARGNPGPAGIGVILRDESGTDVVRLWGYLGEATNNVAEYRAVLAALEEALDRGARQIEVRTDSELIHRQVTGVYKVKKPHLKELARRVASLAGRFDSFRILHVRRDENEAADALANRAMDERASGREPAVTA